MKTSKIFALFFHFGAFALCVLHVFCDMPLDACMGSATTAVAAIRTGRNWIGYEMNENFYKQAQKRIEHALISPTLF